MPHDGSSARAWLRARLAVYGRASDEDPERLEVWLRIRAQVLLAQGPGPRREALLRLCGALE